MAATKKPAETEENKKCFIITPIGGDNTVTRIKADGLIRAVILPVLKELNIDGHAAHHIEITGNITKQVIARIVNDDLVIANLTELNPNVMYELAIRHAKRKPVVVLAEKGTSLPFDIAQERTLFYTDDMIGVEDLKPRLRSAIHKALEEEDCDNPIYNAIEDSLIREVVVKNSSDTEKYILSKLDEITERISTLNIPNTLSSSTPSSKERTMLVNKLFKIGFTIKGDGDIHAMLNKIEKHANQIGLEVYQTSVDQRAETASIYFYSNNQQHFLMQNYLAKHYNLISSYAEL